MTTEGLPDLCSQCLPLGGVIFHLLLPRMERSQLSLPFVYLKSSQYVIWGFLNVCINIFISSASSVSSLKQFSTAKDLFRKELHSNTSVNFDLNTLYDDITQLSDLLTQLLQSPPGVDAGLQDAFNASEFMKAIEQIMEQDVLNL